MKLVVTTASITLNVLFASVCVAALLAISKHRAAAKTSAARMAQLEQQSEQRGVDAQKEIDSLKADFAELNRQRELREASYKAEIHSFEQHLASLKSSLAEQTQITANWKAHALRLQSSYAQVTSVDTRRTQWAAAMAQSQQAQAQAEAQRKETQMQEETHRMSLIKQRAEIAADFHRADSERIRALRW